VRGGGERKSEFSRQELSYKKKDKPNTAQHFGEKERGLLKERGRVSNSSKKMAITAASRVQMPIAPERFAFRGEGKKEKGRAFKLG